DGDRANREGPAGRCGAALARGDRSERGGPAARLPPLEGLRVLSRAKQFLDAIKFEHTIFALPFAYVSMVLAAGGWPGWRVVFWVTAAMAGARTTAMSVNRVVDRAIDAQNPRTSNRHLPRGIIRPSEMLTLAAVSIMVLLVAVWQLNPLCLVLAPLACLFLTGYSY